MDNATAILSQMNAGDASAAERLFPLVYGELKNLASSYFRRQRSDHTLQPTALVHEAFLKMVDQTHAQWNDRMHFFAVAAMAMRQILVNHAVSKGAIKRGGQRKRVGLDDADGNAVMPPELDVIALDEAMKELAGVDERMHRVVELRFFGGLSMEEIAKLMNVSLTTIESDWRGARAWLNRKLAAEA